MDTNFELLMEVALWLFGLYLAVIILLFMWRKFKYLRLFFKWILFVDNKEIIHFECKNGNIVYLKKKDDGSYKLCRAFMNMYGKTVVVERALFRADEEIYAESEFNRWSGLYLSRKNRIDGSKYAEAIYIE